MSGSWSGTNAMTGSIQATNAPISPAGDMAPAASHRLRRGDLALTAGVREHGYLRAELVLFAPLTATKPGTTPSTAATPVPASTMESGTHT